MASLSEGDPPTTEPGAMSDADSMLGMAELLDSVTPIKPLRRGDVVEGVVMRTDTEGIHVNVGAKAEGFVPAREMRSMAPEDIEQIQVGHEIITLVIRTETAEGPPILSVDRAVGEKGWRTLAKAMESAESIEGTIMGFNRGGAIVEAEGVHGFVPMSQLVSVSRDNFRDDRPSPATTAALAPAAAPADSSTDTAEASADAPAEASTDAPAEASADAPAEASADGATEETSGENGAGGDVEIEEAPPKPSDIGKVLTLKVLEVNRSRNRAIFSERQVIEEQRNEQKARLIEELTEGEVRHGRVTGISSFGAFVDLGGADGLVHISELSWNQVGSPEEVVKMGQEVDVYVLKVDAENRKIALSLRRLQPEPWETLNERYDVGDLVEATVTKLTNFGAFARVEGSVEGLIHISELTDRVVGHPREVVREGDSVRLKILRIEPERRRLGLSLKQAEEEE